MVNKEKLICPQDIKGREIRNIARDGHTHFAVPPVTTVKMLLSGSVVIA